MTVVLGRRYDVGSGCSVASGQAADEDLVFGTGLEGAAPEVAELGLDADDAAITSAIIAIAHHLDVRVVAEGVETQQQLAFLREHGCGELQGYLLSPPLPGPAFFELLQQGPLTAAEDRKDDD